MMRVLMIPHVSELAGENGINRVIENYFRFLPDFDIELVEPDATSYDLVAAHAGVSGKNCDVAHLHGIYFTADYNAHEWEWHVNSRVIEACRSAKVITVPSAWVAETFQRDMRLNPHVISHGIVWQEWQHKEDNQGYVLWNKNRNGIDVCDNSALDVLIQRFPKVNFVSTLPTVQTEQQINGPMWPANFRILPHGGKTPHADMKLIVQRAGIYLSLAKETYGIGILEAMASGIPVLGWDWGGNSFLVQHGMNGYLAKPNDIDDLCEGLNFCLKHQRVLGKNGIELAKGWTWQKACKKVAGVYRLAMEKQPASVSVVIPVYNKTEEQLNRAINSIIANSKRPNTIVVVDDGSTDRGEVSRRVVERYDSDGSSIDYIWQNNQGVAIARNNGINQTSSKYVLCLDADDWLEPRFLEACIAELEKDRSLGIAYTSLRAHNADGTNGISQWPDVFNPNKQLSYPKQNQIPTACVFRREAWERVGGYKSRYCPNGAGSEDAALWSAICSIGYNAKKVTDEALFNYSAEGGQVHGNKEYTEMDWLSMYPWAKDGLHPFASVATPKRWSHPVRQFDEPVISVIIPVGPGHEQDVTNALDSLEMQHFRKWEAIVIYDNEDKATPHGFLDRLKISYPYVRGSCTGNNKGAGYSRNLGVKVSRAPLLFFLDADDVLVDAHALDKMLTSWNREEAVIYSDYLGKAVWNYDEAKKAMGDDLLGYNEKLQTAVFRKYAVDFDCSKAQRQPEFESASNMPYYHWCLVSILIPKVWHDEIGGFDESMPTWEDVDYMWRLARYGKCFHRITDALVMYSYHKGYRREASAVTDEGSRQKHENLIQYINRKYEGIQVVGCNCGGKRQMAQMTVTSEASIAGMDDNEWVLIEFDFPGSNTRDNYGQKLGSPTRQLDPENLNRVMEYRGYARRKGERFRVHIKDQRARPDMFKLVSDVKLPEAPKVELMEPVLIKRVGHKRV